MVKIRMKSFGRRHRPFYRICVMAARTPRAGRSIGELGWYDPLVRNEAAREWFNTPRVRYWLSVGAQPTDRVARFLDAAGVKERAARQNLKKGEPGEKAKERAEERASRDAELAAAAAEATEAPEVTETPEATEAPETAEATDAGNGGGDGDATPADEAPNQAESPVDPAEGADDAAPSEGAEKAE